MSIKPYLPVIALAVCAFLLPPVLTAAKSAFYLTQLTMSAYYALASLGRDRYPSGRPAFSR